MCGVLGHDDVALCVDHDAPGARKGGARADAVHRRSRAAARERPSDARRRHDSDTIVCQVGDGEREARGADGARGGAGKEGARARAVGVAGGRGSRAAGERANDAVGRNGAHLIAAVFRDVDGRRHRAVADAARVVEHRRRARAVPEPLSARARERRHDAAGRHGAHAHAVAVADDDVSGGADEGAQGAAEDRRRARPVGPGGRARAREERDGARAEDAHVVVRLLDEVDGARRVDGDAAEAAKCRRERGAVGAPGHPRAREGGRHRGLRDGARRERGERGERGAPHAAGGEATVEHPSGCRGEFFRGGPGGRGARRATVAPLPG